MPERALEKRWVLYPQNSEKSLTLSKALNITLSTAQALINRGLCDIASAETFLNPSLSSLSSPFLLKDMDSAVSRILSAIKDGSLITIYGDYDVDGTTATSLLLHFFRKIGANCNYYIPHRMDEGYGLNSDAVKTLAKKDTQVIITVDNGISAVEEIKLASCLGMDVIVTDHHQLPPQVPPAFAIINPQQDDCTYPSKDLCGVGIAFNLAIAIRSRLREAGFWKETKEPNMKRYLDLVALGTIADIVPIRGDNRILTVFGLKELSSGKRAGMRALGKVSGRPLEDANVGTVGFQYGPRQNAAGRLTRADAGVRLLVTADEEEADMLAAELDEENRERRKIETEILLNALEMIEKDELHSRPAIVLFSENWHPGVIGIVASRIVEKYYRPAILLTLVNGVAKGSARSIEAFHLFKGLESCADHLISFGGHKYAAGLSIKPDSIEDFRIAFANIVESTVKEEDFIPSMKIDGTIALDEINEELINELARLSPFGPSNAEPVFSAHNVEVISVNILKDAHLKLKLSQDRKVLDAIGFNMSEKKVTAGDRISIAFSPSINEWNGRRAVQLKLKDIKLGVGEKD
ncbi:MAG: single-stranded-DNA-specific exonuclease RecJ [Proteobacteria bacterium]|nr:single-stranded-DNA-specific exonuclease RecJ [Pseudomonadota bacterium]